MSTKEEHTPNFCTTGVAGGNVDNTTAIGSQTIHNYASGNHLADLRARTDHSIQVWTEKKKKFPKVEEVMEKLIQSPKKWITITGHPGEGKTTLGFMLLKEMKHKYEVFTIDTPEDYHRVSSSPAYRKSVLLLNETAGKFYFDEISFSRWSAIINKMMESRFQYLENIVGYVIFVVTYNVLKGMFLVLSKSATDLLSDNMFDLTKEVSGNKELRKYILNNHLERGKVKIDEETKNTICSPGPKHGFSYGCKRFVERRGQTRGHKIDIQEYFNNPFHAYEQPIKCLLKNENVKRLFSMLMKNGGKVDIDQTDDDTERGELRTAENQLSNIYLKREKGSTMFLDEIVSDSVAFAIGREDHLFVVKYCTLKFFQQRLRLISMDGEEESICMDDEGKLTSKDGEEKFTSMDVEDNDRKDEDFLYVRMSLIVQRELEKRFAAALMEKKYDFLQLKLCRSEPFLRGVFNRVVPGKENGAEENHENGAEENHENGAEENHIGIYANEEGVNVLMGAASCGNFAATKLLLEEKGVDVLSTDKWKRTALHYVGWKEKVDISIIINLLIEKGIKVDHEDEDGQTALHYMCKERVLNEEILTYLKRHNAKINPQDKQQRIPLHILCGTLDLDVKLVQLLIRYGANTNALDKNGRLPLHYLCMTGTMSKEVLKTQICTPKFINLQDCSGGSPLHYACKREGVEAEFVEILINNDANVMLNDEEQMSPLHYACLQDKRNLQLIETLIKNGADTRGVDKNGHVPLQFLCDREKTSTKVIHYLVDKVDQVLILSGENDANPSLFEGSTKDGLKKLSLSGATEIDLVDGRMVLRYWDAVHNVAESEIE